MALTKSEVLSGTVEDSDIDHIILRLNGGVPEIEASYRVGEHDRRVIVFSLTSTEKTQIGKIFTKVKTKITEAME